MNSCGVAEIRSQFTCLDEQLGAGCTCKVVNLGHRSEGTASDNFVLFYDSKDASVDRAQSPGDHRHQALGETKDPVVNSTLMVTSNGSNSRSTMHMLRRLLVESLRRASILFQKRWTTP